MHKISVKGDNNMQEYVEARMKINFKYICLTFSRGVVPQADMTFTQKGQRK